MQTNHDNGFSPTANWSKDVEMSRSEPFEVLVPRRDEEQSLEVLGPHICHFQISDTIHGIHYISLITYIT